MPVEEKQDKYCFRLGDLSVNQAEEGKKKRTFTGVAYSGEVITDHWYWDRIIFDLDSMQIKGRIPALLDHSSRQRAGVINEYSINHQQGLVVSGDLMSNEFGTEVARDSDDGFPWQMSVRIEPSSVEEIQADASVTVNGKVHQGPITVFRGGRIREVSFCALGADDNTNAVAASHNPTQSSKEDTDVDLEQAKAKIQEQEKTISGLQDQLNKFAADKRNSAIDALAKDLGKEFTAEEKTKFAAMPDDAFDLMAATLKQFAASTQQQPPAGQQQQQAPLVNPALAHLFTHQASTQSGSQPSGNQEHQLSAGAKAFAAQQKGK
ncbi:MAG: hypothetical protein Q4F77_00335 [Acinetobacter sp.]|uniref:hypothetical protein n=1 Tax=Acinetobacter sp. TaxID=472 RepID=UPI0026DFAC16|nr:hypothetical protein [Acinetobacter sp.]MDO5541730.1 hypothetical protein [Acinetobacter sp.]